MTPYPGEPLGARAAHTRIARAERGALRPYRTPWEVGGTPKFRTWVVEAMSAANVRFMGSALCCHSNYRRVPRTRGTTSGAGLMGGRLDNS